MSNQYITEDDYENDDLAYAPHFREEERDEEIKKKQVFINV